MVSWVGLGHTRGKDDVGGGHTRRNRREIEIEGRVIDESENT